MDPLQSKVTLLRKYIYQELEYHELDLHDADMKRIEEDKWLAKIVLQNNSDLRGAALLTVNRCLARNCFGVNDKNFSRNQDKKHSRAIKPVGKDFEGNTLLFIDMTLIEKLNAELDEDHLLYWLERLERETEDGIISLALHHGSEKSIDLFLSYVLLIDDLVKKLYPHFIKTLFIFNDFTTEKIPRNIHLNVHYVNGKNWQTFFVLDSNFDLSDGYLKYIPKNQRIITEENCQDKSSTSQDEVNKKPELVDILTKLHLIECQVFDLIQDVSKLMYCSTK